MGYQENEEVYLTLSRKELQGLCKKHGLPVNHSKNELAKLLVVYFTKRAASKERRTSRGGSSSKPVGTSTLELKRDAEGNAKDARGACRRTVDASKRHGFALKEGASEKGRYSQIADQAGNSSHMGGHTYTKNLVGGPHACVQGLDATSIGSMCMATEQLIGSSNQETRIQQLGYMCSHSGNGDVGQNLLNTGTGKISSRNLQPAKVGNKIPGECSSESGLASSSEVPAEVSASFQFFVRSEEGINLCVDLTTRPSDWINSLKDEVSIYQRTHLDKSWTICDEMRDVGIVDKNLEPSGRVNEMHKSVDSNSQSRSHALTSGCLNAALTGCVDEGNQFVSSSCMTCSRMQNTTASGSLSCAADTEASLQNPADTSSIVNRTNTPVANASPNKILSNLVMNLSTDARVPEHINVKVDNAFCQNVDLSSFDESFNSVSDRSGFSLVRKNQDSSKPSESDGSGACPMSLVNASVDKCLLQSDGGESADHIREEHTCSSLGNSATGNPISTINEKWGRSPLMKDKALSGCSPLNKFDTTSKRTCNSEVPEEFQSKRQHVDTEVHSEPFTNSNSRDAKNFSRESVSDHAFLRRRSIRLVSK